MPHRSSLLRSACPTPVRGESTCRPPQPAPSSTTAAAESNSRCSVRVVWRSSGADFRVEPLSAIDAPEWNLLVAKGDLDELAAPDATRLTQQKWVDLLLG